MIKDRNIAPDAGIQLSKILGAGIYGATDVHYAVDETTAYGAWIRSRVASQNVHSTIQGAVDACIDNRKDVVIVGPKKWKEEVKVIAKRGLVIVGTGTGGGTTTIQMRPGDAATHYPYTTKIGSAPQGAAFHIMSQNVDISGFYLDGGGGYGGIYLGGGLNGGVSGYTTENASGCRIHNNFFRGGSEGQVGLYMNGPRFGVIVENNIFERWTGAGIEIDAGNASTEAGIVRTNQFIADNAGYGIDIYGEANSVLGCQINNNIFGDRASHAFTFAINNRTSSSGVLAVADNFFACEKTMQLVGTDFASGNKYGWAGNATETSNYFETEAAAGAES